MKVLNVRHRIANRIFDVLAVGLVAWLLYEVSVPPTHEGFVRLSPTPLTVSPFQDAVYVDRLTLFSSFNSIQPLPILHGRLPHSSAAHARLVRR
jgi:hypothetical protein